MRPASSPPLSCAGPRCSSASSSTQRRETSCTRCCTSSRTGVCGAARRAGSAWADVDLDAGRLTVRTQLVQLGWEVYEDTPKSDAGDRTIALDAGTVTVLRAHRRQLEARMR